VYFEIVGTTKEIETIASGRSMVLADGENSRGNHTFACETAKPSKRRFICMRLMELAGRR